MKILVIGESSQIAECQRKFGPHEYLLVKNHFEAEKKMDIHDVIFDFRIDENPVKFEIYTGKTTAVFFNTCKISLAQLQRIGGKEMQYPLIGFNGMPTMIERNLLEVSVLKPMDIPVLQNLCERLKTEYVLVDDRVGLVTPRVICMIINEAYYTVQDGTASRDNIDLAMKLGTNYPYGPFEWAEKIGVKYVYELLQAIYEDTKDERYKICPLLKKEYLGI